VSAPRRRRLDAELVRRGLARSRVEAAGLVDAGAVLVRGQRATKAASQVDPADPLLVEEARPGDGPTPTEPGAPRRRWASRGAHKLTGALEACPDVVVAGRRALDAGASTGGFTDVLLDRGAGRVLAVDVGYGQLAWAVRSDPRVVVLDRTNVRALEPDVVREHLGDLPDLVVADLSFISLRLVLPALAACSAPGADHLLMVKPQFEVGRERLGAGGVVRDPAARRDAVTAVAAAAAEVGLAVVACAASPLPGPSGNVEYFLRLRTPGGAPSGPPALDAAEVDAAVAAAVEQGPTGAAPTAAGAGATP
jgi:23S rRNA (cytidine1920-2'-O)/16S rRNA (cytidine1409-2'-O)-methyltransferase